MNNLLQTYAAIVGEDVIRHLKLLAAPLKGARVIHVNSTRQGGGVAEILEKLVPLQRELGMLTDWEVIEGSSLFYQCTKGFHNGLQGIATVIPEPQLREYEAVNRMNAETLHDRLRDADFVFIHDPQPAALLSHIPDRRGKWIWRCHIDLSHPYRPVWRYLRQWVLPYDASVFSLPAFAPRLPHPIYLIPPSIDPLSDKNMDLPPKEIQGIRARFGIEDGHWTMLQVSRFDRFKDPLGVIQAYRLARNFIPNLQLVLAGGGATDDPEGEAVLAEVRAAARDDPAVHILLLPSDAHRTINALQRSADFVLQKSLREGFGLTVSEAMWKGKPVIGGDTGGIRLQVVNHHTGFLVRSPEGAALRIRYLLHNRDKLAEMGEKARVFVRDNFLLTRQLREYLTMMVSLLHGVDERVELDGDISA
jgi:trehalose synthase